MSTTYRWFDGVNDFTDNFFSVHVLYTSTMSTSHPSAFDTLRKQVFAFITGIVVLSHIHCNIPFVSAVITHPQSYNAEDFIRHSTLPDSDTSHRSWTKSNLKVLDHEVDTSTAGGQMTASLHASSRSTRSRQEVAALTSFKAAVSSDPFGSLRSWRANDSTACSWDGVICSSNTLHRHVIGLNLSNLELVGNANSALLQLGRLRFLRSLDLSANVFTNSISRSALANLTGIVHLNMSYNQVQGEIPDEIGEFTDLKTLDFASNNLTGKIPVSVGNCTSLTRLHLGNNFLVGRIPEELGRVLGLEYLNLANVVSTIFNNRPVDNRNALSGSIPASLGNCSSLTVLFLTNNENLGGELPSSFRNLQNLQILDIGVCEFIGVIPRWLGNMTNITALSLSANHFHGEIPGGLGNLPNLQFLSVGRNYLEGAIPFVNSTLLTVLDVDGNFLSGAIPSQLGSLTNLQELLCAGNNFTVVIPSALSNCSRLEVLELGHTLMDPQIIPSWLGSLSNLTRINLDRMNLSGEIPNELGRLSKLQHLVLYTNHLSGAIPLSLSNCTMLVYLVISNNQLTGNVPSELGLLANVELFFLISNLLTGSLPASLANMTHLQYFSAGDNSFDSTISDFWGKLPQLQHFYLDLNKFSGPVPETLGNCSSLLELSISENNLSGEIPSSFGNLSQLQLLDVSNNRISGQIPASLTKCTRLTYLSLDMNQLEGNIASNIYAIPNGYLQHLSLSRNKFTGVMPISLGKYLNLLFLDLSYNQLSGDLPATAISEMRGLTVLNLSHNSFTGSWPHQLGNLEAIQEIDISANNISGSIVMPSTLWKDLDRLDVSINNFSGAIPSFLASLPQLRFFNASYNNFEGQIPDSGVFRSINLTDASFLGNPRLCGVILGPSRECATPNSHHSCKGFACKRAWIPTVCCTFVTAITGMLCLANYANGRKRKADLDRTTIMNFGAYNVKRFSFKDIMKIIDGGEENLIGSGASSVVYRGSFSGPGDQLDVFAIKVFRNDSHGRTKGDNDHERGDGHIEKKTELLQEAEILAKLRHRNIVKVISFCSTLDFKAIILEYMPQGSLDDHLYKVGAGGGTFSELPWEVRLSIACDVNYGMVYLHHDFPEPLIHGDLKPSNILLNDEFLAKVADFGISKFIGRSGKDARGEATASSILGTIGYMPPEYALGTKVSTKGDVYSFGIVLLGLLTGKRPTGAPASADFGADSDYRSWAMRLLEEKPSELLDHTLQEEGAADSIKMDQMKLMLRLALFSTRTSPQSRPSMEDLQVMLMQVKALRPVEPVTSPIFANEVACEIAHVNSPGPAGIGRWMNGDPNDASLPLLSE